MLGCLIAASAAAAEPSVADRVSAKGEYQRAQKSYDLGDFKTALAGYSEAYRLDPRPAFLFNIGQCHRMLGEHERAAFFFDRFLSFYPAGKAPNDKLARELLAEEEAILKAPPPAAPLLPAPEPAPALEPVPFPTPAPLLAPQPEPVVAKSDSVATKWWLWTAVGVVAAGAIVGTAVAVSQPHVRDTTLQPGDFR